MRRLRRMLEVMPRRYGFVVLLLATGCPKDATTTVPATDADVTTRMQDHFETVSEIKDAVIAGDLDTTQELATALRDRTPTGDPAAWKPHVTRMVEASTAAAAASDLAGAAGAAAKLGATCGTCHQSTGADPVFDPGQPPIEADNAAARMRRHQWGVDRMWEGLIVPSAESWRWGAETIDETPGCGDEAADTYRTQLCQKIDALGNSALDARDLEDRARIYGEFLATCSACHNASP